MNVVKTMVELGLVRAGVADFGVKVIPGEGGGVVVRVYRIADIDAAERVGRDVEARTGWEVLVSF